LSLDTIPSQEVLDVRLRLGSSGLATAGALIAAAGVLLLSGCFSFDVGSAIGRQIAPTPAPAAQPAAQPAPQDEPAPAPKQKGGGSAMAYQYQFNAFYGGFWTMGWFGYKEINYKPGQGTIWNFTDSKKKSETMTLERALLKVNADSSQWWRFRFESGKDTVLYEFLVGADSVVKKVRYKDPDTGTVEEFVPSQDQQQPPAGAANAPRSRQELAKYRVDKQNVKVKAGSFATDHYLYNDEKENGSAESWVSDGVPGYMVKTVYTNKKRNQTMTGELIQIESGASTTLGSF
jgi:hypothetical protein